MVALLFARLLIGLTALHSGASNPLDPAMHTRFDSGHYLAIANTGYEFFSCSRVAGMDPNAWCGNAGWFPGYSLMIRVVSWTGVSASLAGMVLSTLFQLGTLWLIWIKLLGGVLNYRNLLCLLLAAVFPGNIYYHAVFPISVFTFFATLSLCGLLERRAFISSAAGALASFSYSTGFLLAPVALIYTLVTTYRDRSLPMLKVGLIAAALTFFGFIAVLTLHRMEVGDWMAFFKVQEKYGHGMHNPLATLWNNLAPLATTPRTWTVDVAPAMQSALVAIFVLSVSIAVLRHRTELTRQDVLLFVYLQIFWLFPLVMGGGVSIYRAEALLAPACPLLRHLPPKLQVVLTVAAAVLAYPMAMLFFSSKLI
ncbi:hypothetical protein DYST_03515 [Dyella terrae]|nr:hypothetical protein DYST_03515 [Dyella terrae]